jgi:hypothetical protein
VHGAFQQQSEDRGADVAASSAASASSSPAWAESATAGSEAGEARHRWERRAALGELPEVVVHEVFVVMPTHLGLLSSSY